jgi:hypothetical protein
MKKSIQFLLLFNIFATSILAQETVYFKRDDSKKSSAKKKGSTELNIVKISPLSFISGFIPVYYERSINETFSGQIGIGITTTNYIKDAIRYAQDGNNTDVVKTEWIGGNPNTTYTNENNFDTYKNRKSTLGYYVSLEPRVYFDSEGLSGTFMGLSFSKTRYNSTSKKVNTTSTIASSGSPTFTSDLFKGNETFTDVFVNFGSQNLYDKISLEYSFGVGLRKVTGIEYAFSQDYQGSSFKYIDGVSTLDKTKVGFNLSLKVGYHF